MFSDLSTLAAVLRMAIGVRYLEGHAKNDRFTVLVEVPRSEDGWKSIGLLAQVCDSCEDELVLIAKAPNSPDRFQFEIVGKGNPEDLAIWLGHLAHRNQSHEIETDDTTDIGEETDEWQV